MVKKFKAAYRNFAHDRPGTRFLNLHLQWTRKAKGPVIRAVAVIIGLVLIVGGILLGLVPGVPGIVLGVLGLALIAAQFRWLAHWCDRVEMWLRGVFKRVRGFFKKRRHRTGHPKSSG